MSKEKIAFVCDTPYQLFVSVSILLSNRNLVKYQKDLYIDLKRCKKASMYNYYQNILHEKIFDNIYIVNSLSAYNRIYNKIEWLFPEISLKVGSKWKIPPNINYKIIWVSGPFMLQRNIINHFNCKTVYFFEDGTGSYSGRIGVNLLNRRGRLIQKITGRGPKYIYPQYVYLFRPELYEGEYRNVIEKIEFPYGSGRIFNRIFVNSESDYNYKGKRIVYLTQPITNKYPEKDSKVLDAISRFSDNIIIRPHPQDLDKDYSGFEIDKSKSLWELVCSKYITDDSILLGLCSTAQVTSKLLLNKEPYIIFTYHLYDSDLSKRFDSLVESVTKIYKKKEKVIVVKSFDELAMVIERILNQEKE